MSHNYETQIKLLTEWFKERLANLPSFVMTKAELRQGTDALKEEYAALVVEAMREWLEERHYELSYNQMCNAFFTAANSIGKISVTN